MELEQIKKEINNIFNTKDIENIKSILSYGNLGSNIVKVLRGISDLKCKSDLDLASQQIVGFKHGKWNRDDVVGLINGMGLTIKEWEELQKNYPIENDLEESEITEINNHFSAI